MEEEAQPEEEAQQPRGGGERGGPGRYFVFVFLVLLVEGAVGYWVIDQAVPAPEVPTEKIEEKEEEKEWVPPIYFEDFKNLTVEPTAFRGNRLVRLSFVVEVDVQAVHNELTVRKDQMWDLVLRRLERLTEANFRNPKKIKLKSDVIQSLNSELKNPGVTQVFITEIVIQ